MRTLGSPLFALLLQAVDGAASEGGSSASIVNLILHRPMSIAVLLGLGLLSVWSWGIFLYKWWTFRRAAAQSAQFIEVFRRSNKFSEVQAVCRSLDDSPLVGLFQTGYAELTAQWVVWARQDGTGRAFDSNTGFTLPKEYFVTGQYSKFIAPGARRVQADSTDSTIKVTAYVDWPRLTIVAFNSNTSGNPAVSFSLAGLPVISGVNPVRTSGTENWAALPEINITGSNFTATLPHQSITTFTATLPPLNLGITRTNNSVTLSWPAGAAGFTLQATDQLTATNNWSTLTNASVSIGNQKVVTLQAIAPARFYRLKK